MGKAKSAPNLHRAELNVEGGEGAEGGYPTNVARVHLATGCPDARAGVDTVKKKRENP